MPEKISLGVPILYRTIDRILAFTLQHVVKYRLAVVKTNLKASFDYVNDQALSSDVKAFYRYLAKILRQVLVTPVPKLLQRRMSMESYPEFNQWLTEGKSVIVTFGHVGNWEWIGSYLGMQYPDQACALYKRIKTDWINALMYKRRKSNVTFLVEIKQMGELLKLIKHKPVLILMASDQNPGSDQGIIWSPFLKRNTAFVNGPETLALRYKLPVVYVHSTSRIDGGYHLTFHTLFDGLEVLPTGLITQRFAKQLEINISAQRSQWLWSHKRWKRTKAYT
jgi:KDO2-lipid IV(A) lauroyltransferase